MHNPTIAITHIGININKLVSDVKFIKYLRCKDRGEGDNGQIEGRWNVIQR